MGIRVLLLGVAIWLLFVSGRRLLRRFRSRQKGERKATPEVNMVSCHHCGLHLPQSEALERDDHYYCCQEHIRVDDA